MLKRHLPLAPLVLAAATLFATAACGHPYYRTGYPPRAYDVQRIGYDNGYHEGLEHGAQDAREGRRFDYRRDSDYRHADEGYRRDYGDRDDYQRAYREGFAAGYTDAFNRGARGPRGGVTYPPAYPPRTGYPDRDAGRGGYRSQAADIGYRDGYEAGRDDAHDRHRPDPISAKRYREGDHGYKKDFGSLDLYKRDYRAAFQQGYERGYQEGRR
jgi:hypothetical protein